uniref:Uncharacterized protein n=1 Tax=Arundo donax TaxID=35708 RepID=A0A0A8Z2B5_ARUDO
MLLTMMEVTSESYLSPRPARM